MTTRRPKQEHVDLIAVEKAMNGDHSIGLNRTEMFQVWRGLEHRRPPLGAAEIAAVMNVSPRTVQHWRSGDSLPVGRPARPRLQRIVSTTQHVIEGPQEVTVRALNVRTNHPEVHHYIADTHGQVIDLVAGDRDALDALIEVGRRAALAKADLFPFKDAFDEVLERENHRIANKGASALPQWQQGDPPLSELGLS